MVTAWIGLGLGLASAVVWGTGDFAGGLATRKARPFQVVAVVSLVGFFTLLAISVLSGASLPVASDWGWAIGAGVAGAIGVTALYRGLAMGAAAIVAPTVAVVGAAVPVFVGMLLQGLPSMGQAAGFIVGSLGIWLVSASPELRGGGAWAWRSGRASASAASSFCWHRCRTRTCSVHWRLPRRPGHWSPSWR